MADKQVSVKVVTEVDDDEVQALEEQLEELAKTLGIELDVDKSELDKTQQQKEDMENDPIEFQVAMDNVTDGLARAKQGVSELKDAISEVQQAGMQSEQRKRRGRPVGRL